MSPAHPRPSEPRSTSRILSGTDDEFRTTFAALQEPRNVAHLLDVPYWELTYLINRSPAGTRYHSVQIRKKNGDTRDLLVPNPGLAILQKKLVQVLSAVYRPRGCVAGFVRGRSIIYNARNHVRPSWLLNVDLRNFFPSINFGRVRGMFRARPYLLPNQVATILAQICCHDNQLPQGAPTSPIVSNMICARLDGELIHLARRHRLTYTRFADDLSFSTREPIFPSDVAQPCTPPPLAVVGPELTQVLRNNGFDPNPTKTRLQGRRTRQEVTGITVCRFPNVPRTFVRRLRAMVHAWERFGYQAAETEYLSRYNRRHRAPHRPPVSFRNVIRGHFHYLAMVRGRSDPIVQALRSRYAHLDPAFVLRTPAAWHDLVARSLWILECETDLVQGTAFAITNIGLITCSHVLGTNTRAFRADQPETTFPVEIVARSPDRDLAILRISDNFRDSLALRANYEPRIGDLVNSAGFPNYRVGSTASFIPQRIVALSYVFAQPRALVDGPIVAGMSGGPVVDENSQVIGVLVTGAETMSQVNSMEHGFIPSQMLIDFLCENGMLQE